MDLADAKRLKELMELNCLPRRVARRKGRSFVVPALTGRAGMKWALPSSVGKLRSAQRWGPPHWNWSPCSFKAAMPA